MPIIPIAKLFAILDEQRGLPRFYRIQYIVLYIYIYSRPCKLKNLRRRSNAYYTRITFLFERNFPVLPSIFPHFFNIHPRVPLLAPSIFLLILNLLPRSKFVQYTGVGRKTPTLQLFRCSSFGVRWIFQTVHALHFARQGWTEGSKQVCRAGL